MPVAARVHDSLWRLAVMVCAAAVLLTLPMLVAAAISGLLAVPLLYIGILFTDWGPAAKPDVLSGRLIFAALVAGAGGFVMLRAVPFAAVLGGGLGTLAFRGKPKRAIIVGCALAGPFAWALSAALAFPASWLKYPPDWLMVTGVVAYFLLVSAPLLHCGQLTGDLLCRLGARLRPRCVLTQL